ncbi:IS66 Orf2 family protein [Magnetococcus marinus MC-1]|uniref:IS66 Orf2 family protein n=1 Tax=Magnetococcus marinus (strain ATCC BAA-1437 / JCM 17883 / MC-1) TaxID=156889 RepID=A0LAX4_MAGMM|nr:IS66 family insertion sequence element accessory protein TnpB [Magnetococcus marinus]ABK45117.1 IS66 Orf2 family protein [Magnetococcus marinus MC-1]ABK45147.1 IS66 Orf2 family protein [Magnetococcus marinus MC-1]
MMRPAADLTEVHICLKPVDFRKGINGLAVLVESELALNPFESGLFVFTNRGRDKIKVLYWERNGFCLWQKRLEAERFHWPSGDKDAAQKVTGQQLNWLLDGYNLNLMQPHKKVQFSSII